MIKDFPKYSLVLETHTLELTIDVNDGEFEYEWWHNGFRFLINNSSTLMIDNVAPDDEGIYYVVVVNPRSSQEILSHDCFVEVYCNQIFFFKY